MQKTTMGIMQIDRKSNMCKQRCEKKLSQILTNCSRRAENRNEKNIRSKKNYAKEKHSEIDAGITVILERMYISLIVTEVAKLEGHSKDQEPDDIPL